ncbi:MAG: hypothetical protein FWD76_02790, partial [Firmicutes bacterium]|nr:hypothetical protein [Bacillota bacterium]
FVECILGMQKSDNHIKINPHLPQDLHKVYARCNFAHRNFAIAVVGGSGNKWSLQIGKTGYHIPSLPLGDWLEGKTLVVKKVE